VYFAEVSSFECREGMTAVCVPSGNQLVAMSCIVIVSLRIVIRFEYRKAMPYCTANLSNDCAKSAGGIDFT
jgi:hypothetical protein